MFCLVSHLSRSSDTFTWPLSSTVAACCWVNTLSFAAPLHCWTDVHSLISPSEMPPRLHWALSTLFPYNKLSCLSQALLRSFTILTDHLCTLHGCHYEVLCYSIHHLGNSHQSKGRTPVSCPLHTLFRPLKSTFEYSSTDNLLKYWLGTMLAFPEQGRNTTSYLFKGAAPTSPTITKAPPLCSPHEKPSKPCSLCSGSTGSVSVHRVSFREEHQEDQTWSAKSPIIHGTMTQCLYHHPNACISSLQVPLPGTKWGFN